MVQASIMARMKELGPDCQHFISMWLCHSVQPGGPKSCLKLELTSPNLKATNHTFSLGTDLLARPCSGVSTITAAMLIPDDRPTARSSCCQLAKQKCAERGQLPQTAVSPRVPSQHNHGRLAIVGPLYGELCQEQKPSRNESEQSAAILPTPPAATFSQVQFLSDCREKRQNLQKTLASLLCDHFNFKMPFKKTCHLFTTAYYTLNWR